MVRSITFLLISILLLTSVKADTIILKNGGKTVGKVTVTDEKVFVEVREGMKVAFSKSEVKEIIFEKTPYEDFDERFHAITKNDTAAFYALGFWAKEQKLKKESLKCFKKVIELEPDHSGARKELGFTRHKDKWLSLEESMIEKGMVNYKGRWVKPEEKERIQLKEKVQRIKKEVSTLIKNMTGRDKLAAQEATEKYLKINDPLALPALAKGASHSDLEIRLKTVTAYGNFPHNLVTEPLVKIALSDKKSYVRTEAAKILNSIKSPIAYMEFLKKFFYDKNGNVRLRAITALGILRDKNSVRPLIEAVFYEIKKPHSNQDNMPTTFIGTQSRRVVGFRAITDSTGRTINLPIIGSLEGGFAINKPAAKENIIFNLGARLALKELTNKDFNYNKQEWRTWWNENKDKFDDFMEPVKPEKK